MTPRLLPTSSCSLPSPHPLQLQSKRAGLHTHPLPCGGHFLRGRLSQVDGPSPFQGGLCTLPQPQGWANYWPTCPSVGLPSEPRTKTLTGKRNVQEGIYFLQKQTRFWPLERNEESPFESTSPPPLLTSVPLLRRGVVQKALQRPCGSPWMPQCVPCTRRANQRGPTDSQEHPHPSFAIS